MALWPKASAAIRTREQPTGWMASLMANERSAADEAGALAGIVCEGQSYAAE